jgi:hypothetical protein
MPKRGPAARQAGSPHRYPLRGGERQEGVKYAELEGGIVGYIDRLLNPGNYYEADIQEAIVRLWPCLFANYILMDRHRLLELPNEWQPDLVAWDPKKLEILIIELKGRPAANNREDTKAQVLRYATWFHERYPDTPARCMIIGPWRLAKLVHVVECSGYQIAMVSAETLGAFLVDVAESVLLWRADDPFGQHRHHSTFEAMIEQFPAYTPPASDFHPPDEEPVYDAAITRDDDGVGDGGLADGD